MIARVISSASVSFGGDPDRGAFGCPFGMIDQSVVDGHLKCCCEGVQVGVHSQVLQGRCL